MDCSPEQFKAWIEILSPYGIGGVAVVVLIFYREAVIEIIKTFLSHFKKK